MELFNVQISCPDIPWAVCLEIILERYFYRMSGIPAGAIDLILKDKGDYFYHSPPCPDPEYFARPPYVNTWIYVTTQEFLAAYNQMMNTPII